jgi:plastocyanin
MKGLISLFLLAVSALSAGTIVGTVSAQGVEPAPGAGSSGGYGSLRYKLADKVDYDHLRDFVVWIDQKVAEEGKTPVKTITQRNASFEPHVTAIEVGSVIRWPNADDIFHNVFSNSDPKPFDLGMYTKGTVKELTFDQTGQVDVFCSIHSKMHCIILVLPSRFFAQVDAHQHFAIKGIPAGTYRVKAWQERMPPLVKTVVVPESGEVTQDFTLGLSSLPQY